MRGEAIVTFDFEFEYSNKGTFEKEFAIKVKAPSLPDHRTHLRMVALAQAAQVGVAINFSKLERRPTAVEAELALAEPEDEIEAEDERTDRVLSTFASGLGPDKFADEMEALKKALTKNARLASIGETGLPITDEVWMTIAEAGGAAAIDRVLAAFLGFFLDAPSKSPSKNGKNSPVSSSAAGPVH